MPRGVPLCSKCNDNHYNFQSCRPPQTHPGWGQRWGTARTGAQVLYVHPARARLGSLIGPDGDEYQPPEAA